MASSGGLNAFLVGQMTAGLQEGVAFLLKATTVELRNGNSHFIW